MRHLSSHMYTIYTAVEKLLYKPEWGLLDFLLSTSAWHYIVITLNATAKENASITSSSAFISNALTKVFHASKTNSQLKRIWPKLWLNLNMCMQFPVFFFLTLVGFGHLWAYKKKAKHKMICYIVQPCTIQPNQPRKKSRDRSSMREEHLFLAGIHFSCEYLPV